jgi:succinate-semialdehyde dehydrogenase/glutarate-semialdehyde dehydrogenase
LASRAERTIHFITMPIASINPATGETLKEFSALDPGHIEEKLAKAAQAFERHRRTSFAQRAQWMLAAAQLLEQEKEQLARIITLEMGKLSRAGIEEVTKCVRGCRFYAEKAEGFLAEKTILTDAARSYVRYEPIGAVLAIMPWNFPFWQVFRFAAPGAHGG